MSGTYGPTQTTREQWKIGREQFEEIEANLNQLLDVQIDAFEKRVEQANVPLSIEELEIEGEED